jgi:transcriptional regulator with XRE-family HTH domain
MTQRELGDAVGVTQKTVDSWEHDRHYPKSSIGALEEVLRVSLGGDARPAARPVSRRLRADIVRILDDPDDQRRVIGLLEGTLTWPRSPAGPDAADDQREDERRPRAL